MGDWRRVLRHVLTDIMPIVRQLHVMPVSTPVWRAIPLFSVSSVILAFWIPRHLAVRASALMGRMVIWRSGTAPTVPMEAITAEVVWTPQINVWVVMLYSHTCWITSVMQHVPMVTPVRMANALPVVRNVEHVLPRNAHPVTLATSWTVPVVHVLQATSPTPLLSNANYVQLAVNHAPSQLISVSNVLTDMFFFQHHRNV